MNQHVETANYLMTLVGHSYRKYSGTSEGIVTSLCTEQSQLTFLLVTQTMTVAHLRVLWRQLTQQLRRTPAVANTSSSIRDTVHR